MSSILASLAVGEIWEKLKAWKITLSASTLALIVLGVWFFL